MNFNSLIERFLKLQNDSQTSAQDLSGDLTFGSMINNLSFMLPFSTDQKLQLLSASTYSHRAFLLQTYFEAFLNKFYPPKSEDEFRPVLH